MSPTPDTDRLDDDGLDRSDGLDHRHDRKIDQLCHHDRSDEHRPRCHSLRGWTMSSSSALVRQGLLLRPP
jgi:hypothetical protein